MISRPVIYSMRAEKSLQKILDYIALKASARIAIAYIARIRQECSTLAYSAGRGEQMMYSRTLVRRFGFEKSAAIIYVTEADRVVIVNVTYRGINVPRSF